ncbi:hypothetical protein [Streptomyces sp. NPDC005244]|uniref:hypothetical protein n=1 Tax=Streptomyces sp. NPDC005244 TaxID=3364708 RepID=UPI0036CF006E
MDVSMGVVAVAGGTLVLVMVVGATVALGLRALDRARPEDVPVVTEQVMCVLRDSRHALTRRFASSGTATGLQEQTNAEGRSAQ